MSRTLWLHLGTFKAGSSRIQQEAWGQRHDLQERGWLYPTTGLVTGEPEVGHRHSRLVYHRRYEDRWPALLDDVVAEIGASDATNVLLSSEAWSEPRAAPALTDLLSALRKGHVVDEVRGVLYLRNRYAYARSMYREMTRRRVNERPMHEYVERPRRRRMLNPLTVVRALTKALDPGSLTVYPYEQVGDTAQHLFGLLGLDAAPSAGRVNAGIDALEVEACRQLKRLAPELRDQWPGLYAVTSRDEWPADVSERFRLDEDVIDDAWRRRFGRLTGWGPAEVDRLLMRPDDTASDVLAYSDDLRRVVEAWVRERQDEPAAPNPAG